MNAAMSESMTYDNSAFQPESGDHIYFLLDKTRTSVSNPTAYQDGHFPSTNQSQPNKTNSNNKHQSPIVIADSNYISPIDDGHYEEIGPPREDNSDRVENLRDREIRSMRAATSVAEEYSDSVPVSTQL